MLIQNNLFNNYMIITKISIKKVVQKDGLIAFVSIILDDCLYLGNIAVFTKLNKDGYRLIFPEKKIGDKRLSIFHPLTSKFYFLLEERINKEIKNDN